MRTHDPRQAIEDMRSHLAAHDRRLSFLFGAGLSLTGSGTTAAEFGIWDAGAVRTSLQEFGGRVTPMDSPGTSHYHATHVTGTMVAEGAQPTAQGMSYEANLAAYDWTTDEIEMAATDAAGMNTLNHTCGLVVGWRYVDIEQVRYWYWFGDIGISTTEDYHFGYYSGYAQEIDDIAYNSQYYLFIKSTGNDRNDGDPGHPSNTCADDNCPYTTNPDQSDADNDGDGDACVISLDSEINTMKPVTLLEMQEAMLAMCITLSTISSDTAPRPNR